MAATKNVNVADQAFKPDLKVDSLAIPLDDDVLVPVADQSIAPVTGNPLAVTFPTPSEVVVGEQAPGSPSQDFSQVPGVPPLYLPFPPSKSDPNIQRQSVTAGVIAEFTVAAPDISIQTNITPAIVEDYTITAVLDADTGLPPVTPNPATNGTFDYARSGGAGIVTLFSLAALPPALVDGEAVSIVGTVPSPSPYDGYAAVSNVIPYISGSIAAAAPNIAATGTTLASATPLPPALSTAKWAMISGSGIPAYNGLHSVSNIVSLSGTVSSVVQESGSLTTSTVVASAPTSLVAGQLIGMSGTGGAPPAGYDKYWTVSNVVNLAGSISSIVNSTPGTSATVNLVGTVPAGLVAGQSIMLSGTPDYDGPATVLSATAGDTSFVIVWTNAASPTDNTGAWTAYTFDIGTPYTGFTPGPSPSWFAYAYDIDAANTGTSTGNWFVSSFDIPGAYTVTAQGKWTYIPAQAAPTTRYKLFVTPASLASFGISMLGRQIVFDDPIVTVANEGASRLITGYASNWIVIDRNDPADVFVPALADPQPGDTFTLDTQREASEVVSSTSPRPIDINVSTSTQPIQAAANVYV